MCEFCTKHGEGKKWYLNVKNYGQDLLSDVNRYAFTKDFFYWLDRTYRSKFNILRSFASVNPLIGSLMKGGVKRWLIYKHWGQVVPIEDVDRILSITNSITRVPCVCRKITTGKEHRMCLLISINPEKIGIAEIVDKSFFGGPNVTRFEKISKENAMSMARSNERAGLIHTIWTFKAPFIGGLCSCDMSSGCIAMRMYKEVAPVLFKAEYIASLNADRCTGCGQCVKACQFNALYLDKEKKKTVVINSKCYGCGLCRVACKEEALFLANRQ